MKFKKLSILVFAGLLIFALVGCTDKESTKPNPNPGVTEGSKPEVALDTIDPVVAAMGEVDYTQLSYAEKVKILGQLESYGLNNHLTGIPVYANAAAVQYSSRITKPVSEYITGYGFGVLEEGSITAPLTAEQQPVAAYRNYYHDYQPDDNGTINYADSKESTTNDLISLMHGSFYEARLSADKTSYTWEPLLATGDIIPVDANANGFTSKFRIPIGVGADYVYRTESKNSAFSQFNNTEIQPEDYITTIKNLYDLRNNLGRGTGEGFVSGSSEIVGMKAYSAATKDNQNSQAVIDAAWDNVGYKHVIIDGVDYIELEYVTPLNSFFAQYYSNSTIFQPIPQAFYDKLKEVVPGTPGPKTYGTKGDGSLSPVDTSLTTGPYIPEYWENDKAYAFKKNTSYKYADSRKIEGVFYHVLSSTKTDPLSAFNQFEAGKIDYVAIPKDLLNEEKSDEKTVYISDTSVFKLNVNTTTNEEWEEYFGTEGTVTTTPVNDYWDNEPALSNNDFVKGLFHSINREEYADKRGRTSSSDYFASNYMWNPETGESYKNSDAHKTAVKGFMEGTEKTYGYSVALAQQYFKVASETLIKQGVYKAGDTIEIEIAWQAVGDEATWHNDIKQYLESAFNGANTGLNLKVNFWAGNVWHDVYYKKMLVGQYDIAFGSISGSALDPLGFMNNLMSDNPTGLVLSYGRNTDIYDTSIQYDGKTWSFESLWYASNETYDMPAAAASALTKSHYDEVNKTRSVELKVATNVDGASLKDVQIRYFVTEGNKLVAKYIKADATYNNGIVTFVVPANIEALGGSLEAVTTLNYSGGTIETEKVIRKF